jgi:hypothetical protein
MPNARTLSLHRALVATALSAALLAGSSGPASAATAPYLRLEKYALSLLNCTRTGGWVTDTGRCKGRGSGRYSSHRRPLEMHRGIADDVARPYARRMARYDLHSHGDYDARFRRAGFTSSTNGESIGWSSGYTVRRMVIRISRMFQAERTAPSGADWHWRNLKNPDFHHVGIGIAVISGEKRIVWDFYR